MILDKEVPMTTDEQKREFEQGFRDALNDGPCRPKTTEYVNGYERGLEARKIGQSHPHGSPAP